MVSTVKRAIRNNIVKIYVLGFFMAFMVVMPVFVPLLQGFDLSMSQILQTQAIFALTIALCEVPSGYIADIWGRKNALVLGTALNAVGFVWMFYSDSFVDFVIYETILGVGMSMASGADLALLYDSEAYLKDSDADHSSEPSKSISRLVSIEAGAAAVAGLLTGLLMIWSLELVVLVQAVTGLLPLFLALSLVEPPRPFFASEHGNNAKKIVELLIFGKPVVLWTAIAIVLFGLMSLYAFWVYQKYWQAQGIPLIYFGYIWAGYGIAVSLSARWSIYLEQRLGARQLLILTAALPVIGFTGMAFFAGWVGILFGIAIQVSRGLSLSIFYEALNRRVPGEFRATVNSLVSLGTRGSFIITGPILGIAVDRLGVDSTLAVLAAVFAPLAIAVVIPLCRRIKKEQRLARKQGSSPQAI